MIAFRTHVFDDLAGRANLTWCISILVLLYYIFKGLYNAFLHPLRNYPGPFIGKLTSLADSYYHWKGTSHLYVHQLHLKYGQVVRLSPNELSYTSFQAWQDIYTQGQQCEKRATPPFPKHPQLYFKYVRGVADLFRTNDRDHRRIRRVLSWSFSERAVQAQEPIIQYQLSKLMNQLMISAKIQNTATVDLAAWFDCIIFDAVGDLLYGKSFESLQHGQTHPDIVTIHKNIQLASFIRLIFRMPYFVQPLLWALVALGAPKSAIQRHISKARLLTGQRMDRGILERHDWIDEVLLHNKDDSVSREEIIVAARIIVTGASETSPLAMSAAIYYLLTTPGCFKHASSEVRTAFIAQDEITFRIASKLPYLNAVIKEAMRVMAPAPSTATRIVPPGYHVVCGEVVPGGTAIGVHPFSAFRSPDNFFAPDTFYPERWLADGDPRFLDDNRQVVQPFGVGPRRCIGENIAMAEMRVILASLLWQFDMELQADSLGWTTQKSFLFWQKPPLYVKLVPVSRT